MPDFLKRKRVKWCFFLAYSLWVDASPTSSYLTHRCFPNMFWGNNLFPSKESPLGRVGAVVNSPVRRVAWRARRATYRPWLEFQKSGALQQAGLYRVSPSVHTLRRSLFVMKAVWSSSIRSRTRVAGRRSPKTINLSNESFSQNARWRLRLSPWNCRVVHLMKEP